MLTGMPSTEMARSVPWSRLNPRRKYWLALPSPECWVTIRPGTASSTSPTREAGREFNISPLMTCSLAAAGWRLPGPEMAEPDVTPLAAVGAGGFGCTTVVLRALRAEGSGGLIRFGGDVSGEFTVTGGS